MKPNRKYTWDKHRKAYDIKWDVDEPEDLDTLPTEIIIPTDIPEDIDIISNYITDLTGFCHKGFAYDSGTAKK